MTIEVVEFGSENAQIRVSADEKQSSGQRQYMCVRWEKAVLAVYLLYWSNKRVSCVDVVESEHSKTVSGETEVAQPSINIKCDTLLWFFLPFTR